MSHMTEIIIRALLFSPSKTPAIRALKQRLKKEILLSCPVPPCSPHPTRLDQRHRCWTPKCPQISETSLCPLRFDFFFFFELVFESSSMSGSGQCWQAACASSPLVYEGRLCPARRRPPRSGSSSQTYHRWRPGTAGETERRTSHIVTDNYKIKNPPGRLFLTYL